MAETNNPDLQNNKASVQEGSEDSKDLAAKTDVSNSIATMGPSDDGKDMGSKADVHKTAIRSERTREAYGDYPGFVGMPSKGEVWLWCLYELCSYFIPSILIPVLFPLIISQIINLPPEPVGGWTRSHKGLFCWPNEMKLYEALTHRSIILNSLKFSPLEWTSFSWAIGLTLAAPILGFLSIHLDYGRKQLIIVGAAIATGAFFCLPTGFFNVTWIFPPYIAPIVAASTVATTSHTRQLGLMIRGFIGPDLQQSQFPIRRGVSSWLSLYATAAGCLGSAVISTFIYHMLRHGEKVLSLWVVSIFSGLKWAAGISQVIFLKPGANAASSASSIAHFFSIFRYPHAFGSLIVVFLSSFTTMCIFTGALLYLIGQICFKPLSTLYLCLAYFIFPVVSLPFVHPLQHVVKANAVTMHLLGLFVSIVTSGAGFYFRHKIWERKHVLVFAAFQSTSVGLLHAYGRVLLIDCSPHGKEGAFSAWLSWCRALGTFVGFAVASAIPGNISTSFGVAFCTAISGVLLLIYGNISDFGGAMDAGHVINEDTENVLIDDNRDIGMKIKEYI